MSLISHAIIYAIGKNAGKNEQPVQYKTVEVQKEICLKTETNYVVDNYSITGGLIFITLIIGVFLGKKIFY